MGLLYPCFATRAEIEAAAAGGAGDPDGAPLYPGLCRDRDRAEVARRRRRASRSRCASTCRQRSPQRPPSSGAGPSSSPSLPRTGARTIEARPERWGDAVIVRKDVPASYHLAVVVDDAWQGVTHVTRGRDLYPATDLHRLLQVLLDLPAPVYHHHRLITDDTGRKLAKSARDTSLQIAAGKRHEPRRNPAPGGAGMRAGFIRSPSPFFSRVGRGLG